MYAVIKAGGKQHRVKAGDVIEVELIHRGQDEKVTFTPILVVDDDGKAHVGKDLGKASVTAKLLGEKKGDKIKVFKYRPKTGYAKTQGHRQLYTLVEIQDVKLGGRAAAKKTEEPKPAPEKEVEGAKPEAVAEAPVEPAAEAAPVTEAAAEPEAAEPKVGVKEEAAEPDAAEPAEAATTDAADGPGSDA
ncbi:MAG TPA: 50S ribosomal protein L21 [Actinomycetota bacterium]